MDRLTEFRKDLNRYEYKQDEKGYCWISERQIVNKLGELENIFELIEEMYKKPVCWKLDNGDIVSEDYSYENIYYDFRKNEIVIYGYGFLASYKVEEYGNTWWLKDES